MARMCCDSRRSVRQTSITYLQRALLSHDLLNLTTHDWHACFTQVTNYSIGTSPGYVGLQHPHRLL